eukprot:SAG31_NODE_17_length_35773_cov_25.999271_39_plen_73_part_00
MLGDLYGDSFVQLDYLGMAVVSPFLAFGLAGAAEAFDEGRSGAEVCKEVCKTVGVVVLGMVGCCLLMQMILQ